VGGGSGSLRASVRGVREGAGDKLLGICLFRLPTRGDAATLRLAEVAAALRDREPEFSTTLGAGTFVDDGAGVKEVGESVKGDSNRLLLTAENDGEGGAAYGDGALTVTLRVPRGSLRGVARLEGFDTFETLCETLRGEPAEAVLRPCGAPRATAVRLTTRAWPAGARASAGLSFESDAPARLAASVAVRRDDGRVWERRQELGAR